MFYGSTYSIFHGFCEKVLYDTRSTLHPALTPHLLQQRAPRIAHLRRTWRGRDKDNTLMVEHPEQTMPSSAPFTGDRKKGASPLTRWEDANLRPLANVLPSWLGTHHLTLLTILWSLLVVLCGFLAEKNIHWFWGINLLIVLQYLTDLWDGTVGRMRDTGLVRWGFYMDHFLDYLFLCAICIGYFFVVPKDLMYQLFFLMAVCGAFMTHSFLHFAATGEFQTLYMGIGPTAVRIGIILINALLIFFGDTYTRIAISLLLACTFLGLIVTVYKTQRDIWKLDEAAKGRKIF